jgi:WD40 repeat protein
VNLHGPVRANASAGAGDATVTVRFDAWKEGHVAPTTHTIRVEAPRVKLTLEPVAPELRKTLVHPDRKASTGLLQFSPDGGKLFVAGYPSGVVQVFDVATGKELRRVAGPRGYRSSMHYAVPSADWRTIYIAVESRKGERVTKDGKTVFVPNYSGEIRVFDVATGEEKPPLKREGNGAVSTIELSPEGKSLLARETFSTVNDKGERSLTSALFEWDPVARTARENQKGYGDQRRSKDGRWSVASQVDYQALTTRLAVTDTKAGKKTVLLDEKKMTLGFTGLSPEGRFLAVSVYRHDKGRGESELRVWDLATLQEVPLRSLKLDAILDLIFSPDGAVLAAWTNPGGTRLIDTKTWTERVLPGKDARDSFQRSAFSADGKRLALVATRLPESAHQSREPDPLDYPQSRIYVYDLAENSPPRVFVCPQGFMTRLEFDPTGKWLAAGATGGVWMLDVGK